MKRTVSLMIRFAAILACSGVLLIDVAIAQSATHDYRIASEPLDQALRDFSLASGVDLLFSPDLVAGKTSPALQGNFTIDEGLRTLLRGSGLEFTLTGSRVVISRMKSDPARQDASPTSDTSSSNSSAQQAQSDAPADLQQDSDKSEKQSAQPIEEVRVTGTRIRGAPPASPIITLTRDDMERAGFTDLGDAGRSIPQNFSGGENPGIAGGGSQAGANNLNNASALNLRGLGPDATLTLVNGHRVAYDAINQGVDISAIPIAAVERVDIMPDGASALYGSDAVAGVANVILRRDFQGIEAAARYGGSTDGGNQQQRYDLTTGRRWDSGGMIVALEDSRYTAIDARDRSYTQAMYGSQTLVPGQKQHSAVLAGHQRLADGLELELDSYINDRTSELINDFSNTAPVTTSGLWNLPRVESYEVTPTLRYQLGAGWEASLSGTYSGSKTAIPGTIYSGGSEVFSARSTYDDSTDSAELNAEGPLFSAPGGEARLAAGGGYRSSELHANAIRTLGGITSTTTNFTDSRDVYFGYGELSVPLVNPERNLRFAHALTFNAAVRHESYRGLWNVTTPKFGLIFAPTSDVTLRTTWGKSFKAATLYQDDTIPTGQLTPASSFLPQPSGGRPVLALNGGSPTPLNPERATTWTASIGIRPSAVPHLALEATYFDIRYRDRIAAPITSYLTALGNPIFNQFIVYNPTPQQVLNAVASLPTGLSNETNQPFDPSNVAAIINDFLRNASRDTARGVDFTGNYGIDLGAESQLTLMTAASYLDSDTQLSEGQPTLPLAGLIFNPPHWRARASGTWERANVSLTGAVNYLGGERDNRYLPVEYVGSFTTFDAGVQIRSTASAGFFRDFEVGVSGLNLANRKPASIRVTSPILPTYDSLNYSVDGRFVGLTVTKEML